MLVYSIIYTCILHIELSILLLALSITHISAILVIKYEKFI